MESSEEDEDFLTHEWITPQSSINSIYQSDTEKVPTPPLLSLFHIHLEVLEYKM